jgi:hypothetical protein
MSLNVIIVMSTIILGSVVMYWLQEWTDGLKRRVQLSTARPAAFKILDVAIESPKAIVMGRDDERVSTAVSFAVQLPLQAPYMVRSPWIVEALHVQNLQAGVILPVKFDSRSGRVVFPNVGWAAYDWRRASQVLPLPETEADKEPA